MVTKKEEKAVKDDLAKITAQLNKIAGGKSVNEDVLRDSLKKDLEENRGNVMVAFLDGEEVTVVHLNSDNLNNADFIKRLMGG